ncbi:MAG: hypothetical protein IPM20_09880 [Gammaproteobacteria bacterium]|nr:hypothetical protein [Gammaproteobacteria bacterium]
MTRVTDLRTRTARGPSMSAGPGKVVIQRVSDIRGERAFIRRFVHERNQDRVQHPPFASYAEVTWLDDLKPALGAGHFFFEPDTNAG